MVALVKLWQDGVSQDVVAFAQPSRVLIFAGTSVYAFEGIALVIPIREGMEKPEYFPHMLVGMMLFFVVFLTGFGILGYFAWGNAVKAVALNELPGTIGMAIQLLYILAIFCGYPLVPWCFQDLSSTLKSSPYRLVHFVCTVCALFDVV